MLQALKHNLYHSRVIKKHILLLPRIAAGYVRTLLLRQTVLRTVEFALLAECNSRCIMCYASRLKKEGETYLSVPEYASVWKQASRLGAFSAILSGGEPTLRKELIDIISVLEPSRSIIALVTNALALTEPYLRELKKAGVNVMHFSLDSTDEKENDHIRGAVGHFRQVVAMIDVAKKCNVEVYLSTVIGHNGLQKMERMVSFARQMNVGIVFSLACIAGNWADNQEMLLTESEWQEVQRYMRAHPIVRSDWTINFSGRQECPGGREKINVSCYGDVMGCGMNYVSFGNVRKEPLETILKRMRKFPDFKRRSRDCLIGADRGYIQKYIAPLAGLSVPVQIDQHPTHPISLDTLDDQTS
jgi:MoaA/NifB/PqqE/SkfB family radical SAM enzyme